MEAIEIKKRTLPTGYTPYFFHGEVQIKTEAGDLYAVNPNIEYFDTDTDLNIEEDIINLEELTDEEFSNIYKACLILYQSDRLSTIYNKIDEEKTSFTLKPSIIDRLNTRLYKDLYEKVEHIDNIIKNLYDNTFKIVNPSDNTVNFYINFPEVKITNDEGRFRILKNLVVNISFIYENKVLKLRPYLKGTRLTWTELEASIGYRHSHLYRNRNDLKFTDFCLGDTQVKTTLLDLSVEFDDMNFELFLCMLKNYVSHESLSGGPYIKMSEVRPSGNYFSLGYRIKNYVEGTTFLNRLTKYNISYNSDTKLLYVTYGQDFIDEIIALLETDFKKRGEYMVSHVDGTEYIIGSVNSTSNLVVDNVPNDVHDVAKGLGVTITKEKDDVSAIKDNVVLSPTLLKLITNKLSSDINNYYLSKYGTCGF